MNQESRMLQKQVALTVFVAGGVLAVLSYRVVETAIYPLYVITFPSCLLLLLAPIESVFDAFAVLLFSSWLNGHIIGRLAAKVLEARQKDRKKEESEFACPSCSTRIAAGVEACQQCGWTYKK